MTDFLNLITSFPMVVYTALLGLVMAYWVFVIVGVADIHAFGSADGVDGLIEGGAEGAAEAAAEGGVEGATEGAAEGGGLVADAVGVLSLLGLRRAPATVVGTLFVLWGWLLAYATIYYLGDWIGVAGSTFVGVAVLMGAGLLAIPLTSLFVRPIAPLFETSSATRCEQLVGKTCVIDTDGVDARFGQATYKAPGESMLFQVRCDKSNALVKGHEALIIDFDEKRRAFVVEPLEAGPLETRSLEHGADT